MSSPLDLGPVVPTRIRFGAGAFGEAAGIAAGMGRRALLVTTRSAMARLGRETALLQGLRDHGVAVEVFRDYRRGPTTVDVDRGAARARAAGADLVIALGGGSAVDCGKAIAAVAPGDLPATDYLHGRAAPGEGTLPVLAIPTTAGAGSEANRSAILTDATRPFKDGVRSDRLFPRCAIVDPTLTLSLDRRTTAETGFDVLAHAIESYVSPRARPDADAFALEAAAAVARWLPVALEEPAHAGAREALSRAATTMGFNLTCVGTCLPHRIDKPLCALHPGISHGQSLALLHPAWARRAERGSPERFARLAAILDGTIPRFLGRIGLDRPPASLGIAPGDIPVLCDNVAGDLGIDPVPMERGELPGFLAEVIRG